MKILRERGLIIPHDVAIVGYDDTDLCLAGCSDPTLTTVDYGTEQKSASAWLTQLLALVSGKIKSVREVIRPVLASKGNRTSRARERRVHGPRSALAVTCCRAACGRHCWVNECLTRDS